MPASNAYGADQQFGHGGLSGTDFEDDRGHLDADDSPQQTEERDKELCHRKPIRDECLKVYKDVERGFSDQWERANAQMDYWEIYHCQLGPKQFYSGNSKIFVPIVHDAVNARKTRFVNQIFPQSGKHIEVTASEQKPQALMSLLEFYIRKAKLRTQVMPGLVRNGDIEGQYNIYVRWVRNKRHVAMRVKKQRSIAPGVEIEGDEYDDIVEQTIVHQYPMVEVLPDSDVLVLPFTCDSIEDALDQGGSVTVRRRWSKAKIRNLIRDGEIDEEEGESLLEQMSGLQNDNINKKKEVADAAGVKMGSNGKTTAHVYETWTKIKVEDELRLVRMYLGGPERVVGCKLCPYWCDKVPILSAPVEKIEGTFKGVSKIKFVESMQYSANDALNEGMDSAAYALMPIVMTDPEKSPKTGSMVLNVAAVWETAPQSTQFVQFPQLWKEAYQIVASAKEQIFQTLGVNPAMMPQQTMQQGKKPNQAMIANEQMVDLLTTADAVTTLEGEILSPLAQWFVWLDHQFRDEEIAVPSFGELGLKMNMEKIEPIQMDRRFEFRWYGVEAARSAQQMQMQMASMNVLMQIPPQLIPGKQMDLSAPVQTWVENIFGVRMGAMVFKDVKSQLTIEPQQENQILAMGMPVLVHPLDNDPEHIQAHMQAMQAQGGDPTGNFREHLMMHQQQIQKKQQAQLMAQMQAQQGPQGPPQQQGRGGPRRGAVSGAPRGGQGPPGMVHPDQMRNAMPRPRQAGGMG